MSKVREMKLVTKEELDMTGAAEAIVKALGMVGYTPEQINEVLLKAATINSNCDEKTEACSIVYKTTNYGMVDFYKKNRGITRNVVNNLKISMKNQVVMAPIVLSKDFKIVDGQHRYMAIKETGKDLYFVVDPNADENSAMMMNKAQHNWNLLNHVQFYAADCESYQLLLKLLDEFTVKRPQNEKLSKTTVYATSTGFVCTSSNGSAVRILQDGRLVISQDQYLKLQENLRVLSKFKSEFECIRKAAHTDKLLSTMYLMMTKEKCSANRFYRNIPKYGEENVLLSGNFKECIQTCIDIYNYSGQKKSLNCDDIYNRFTKWALLNK